MYDIYMYVYMTINVHLEIKEKFRLEFLSFVRVVDIVVQGVNFSFVI